jgi:hypothetical protein
MQSVGRWWLEIRVSSILAIFIACSLNSTSVCLRQFSSHNRGSRMNQTAGSLPRPRPFVCAPVHRVSVLTNCLTLPLQGYYDSAKALAGKRQKRGSEGPKSVLTVAMRISVAAAIGLGPLIGSALCADGVDYVRDVKPILAERCYSCHGAIRQKAGLRLDTAALIRRGGESGPAIEPGRSAESILIERVSAGADSSGRMPPPSEGVALGEKEVSTLRAWIDQGAAAPAEAVPAGPRSHWAYMPLTRPAVPCPAGQDWSRNPIDAFLAAAHQSKGLDATPPVSNELLLRRVHLDVVGLTPTRDELHEFLGDQSPGAYEKIVNRLLASPQYGERWGRHWMDVWRYSDWYGLGDEARYSHPHIWQWRDWIVAALNADEGYDRMVVDMLAADELTPNDPDKVRATGYLVRNWDIFNRNTWLANTVEHTARAFLGVTIQCARCHDHKFDPISQSDYYRLRAFFEPMHIRIDRIPGQPDRTKGGLSRAFDDFMETPTFLFIRGDETRPDKRPLTPAVPTVLGGEVRITPVHLPVGASSPDKRDFVIREALDAGEQAIRSARAALGQARENRDRQTQALATAIEMERQSQSKYQASLAKPADAKQARQQAITAVGTLARARRDADDADSALAVAASALTLSELRHCALQAVLRIERLEDDGASKDPCGALVQGSPTRFVCTENASGSRCRPQLSRCAGGAESCPANRGGAHGGGRPGEGPEFAGRDPQVVRGSRRRVQSARRRQEATAQGRGRRQNGADNRLYASIARLSPCQNQLSR